MVTFDTLLRTKIRVPAVRRDLVSRGHLIEQLDSGLENRFTLISAPAGYGKTTLLAAWISQRPDLQVAWLALDETDNDPALYLQYLIAALQVVDAEIGQSILPALQAPNPPLPGELLPPILNQINQREGKIVLILDDYHRITETSIHQITSQFIEASCPGLHLVLATRADPPLPVYRYRARGELTEIRQAHLSFTLDETRNFLLRTVGDGFLPEEIDLLHQRTEGWVVGLRLAELSFRENPQRSESIAAISGNQLYIMEYLVNEVLDRQPERIRDFLLKTSILKRLTGPLCDQLTGFEDGYASLEYLKSENLFLSALDNDQTWYRFHQLFADLLRKRLEREYQDKILTLHKAASDWYAQNGFLIEAIDHIITSGDFVCAASLIGKHAETIWRIGENTHLLQQLQRLPIEIIHAYLPLCLWYSIFVLFRDQHQQAKALLQIAEESIRNDPSVSIMDRNRVLGTQALHESYLALLNLDLDLVILHARDALEFLPEDWLTLRQVAQMFLADASNWRGDLITAAQQYSELLATTTLYQNPYMFFTVGIRKALLDLARGRLRKTYDFCLQSLQQLGELKPRLSFFERIFQVVVDEILIEWNRLDEVKDRLDASYHQFEGLERSSWDILYLSTVRGYLTFKDLSPAKHILELLEASIRSSQLPKPYLNDILAWKARIHLFEGNISLAEQVLAESNQVDCDSFAVQDETVCLVMVRMWLAQGKYQRANRLLEATQVIASKGGRTNRLIEILILRTLSEVGQNHPPAARAALRQAVSLAEPQGFVRIFIEGGSVILHMLKEMVSAGEASSYIRQLITAFGDQSEVTRLPKTHTNLPEPFSERERQVIRLLATYLSQQEIADELYVSVNTIRFHTKNIYRKLGVHNRSEAVAKAKSIEFL
jgi:LuxR family maltose regulon positive regulatory protein